MGNDNIFRCRRNSEAGTAQLVDQKRTQVSLENEMRLSGICIPHCNVELFLCDVNIKKIGTKHVMKIRIIGITF